MWVTGMKNLADWDLHTCVHGYGFMCVFSSGGSQAEDQPSQKAPPVPFASSYSSLVVISGKCPESPVKHCQNH